MKGSEKLAAVLQNQIGNTFQTNTAVSLEIAKITDNLGLKVPRFENEIPCGDFLIDKRLAIDYEPETVVASSAAGGHSHSVSIPLTKGVSKISANDTVLICWVGNDPVVLSIIVDSAGINERG